MLAKGKQMLQLAHLGAYWQHAKTGGVFGEKCKDRWCLEDTTCLKVFEDTPCLKVLSTRLHRKHPGAVRGEFSGETIEAFKHAFQFDGCT